MAPGFEKNRGQLVATDRGRRLPVDSNIERPSGQIAWQRYESIAVDLKILCELAGGLIDGQSEARLRLPRMRGHSGQIVVDSTLRDQPGIWQWSQFGMSAAVVSNNC
jgi:hypothetical protein